MCKTQLEQLVEDTEAALVKEGASVYHLRIFKTVTNHLKRYAKEHNQAEFSLDFGIGFLEDFYSMRERIEKHTFPVIRLYCINEMDDFMKKGAVSVRYGKIPREYTIPAEFKQNYDGLPTALICSQSSLPCQYIWVTEILNLPRNTSG